MQAENIDFAKASLSINVDIFRMRCLIDECEYEFDLVTNLKE